MRNTHKRTTHRDMSAVDFDLLARFCYALNCNRCNCVPIVLDEILMRIPVWSHFSGVWKIDKFKNIRQQAFGVPVHDFRHICRYIKLPEAKVIDILYRFSILGVVPDQMLGTKLKFRQIIEGAPLKAKGGDDWTRGEGFVLERRRAEGNFRSKERQA